MPPFASKLASLLIYTISAFFTVSLLRSNQIIVFVERAPEENTNDHPEVAYFSEGQGYLKPRFTGIPADSRHNSIVEKLLWPVKAELGALLLSSKLINPCNNQDLEYHGKSTNEGHLSSGNIYLNLKLENGKNKALMAIGKQKLVLEYGILYNSVHRIADSKHGSQLSMSGPQHSRYLDEILSETEVVQIYKLMAKNDRNFLLEIKRQLQTMLEELPLSSKMADFSPMADSLDSHKTLSHFQPTRIVFMINGNDFQGENLRLNHNSGTAEELDFFSFEATVNIVMQMAVIFSCKKVFWFVFSLLWPRKQNETSTEQELSECSQQYKDPQSFAECSAENDDVHGQCMPEQSWHSLLKVPAALRPWKNPNFAKEAMEEALTMHDGFYFSRKWGWREQVSETELDHFVSKFSRLSVQGMPSQLTGTKEGKPRNIRRGLMGSAMSPFGGSKKVASKIDPVVERELSMGLLDLNVLDM